MNADSTYERIRRQLVVEPGKPADLAHRDPTWTGGGEFEELSAEFASTLPPRKPKRSPPRVSPV